MNIQVNSDVRKTGEFETFNKEVSELVERRSFLESEKKKERGKEDRFFNFLFLGFTSLWFVIIWILFKIEVNSPDSKFDKGVDSGSSLIMTILIILILSGLLSIVSSLIVSNFVDIKNAKKRDNVILGLVHEMKGSSFFTDQETEDFLRTGSYGDIGLSQYTKQLFDLIEENEGQNYEVIHTDRTFYTEREISLEIPNDSVILSSNIFPYVFKKDHSIYQFYLLRSGKLATVRMNIENGRVKRTQPSELDIYFTFSLEKE